MHRRSLLAAAGTGLATALAGCSVSLFGETVTESFEDSYDIDPGTTVRVANRNGDVGVEPGDDDQLTVSGEKRSSSQDGLDAITVDVSRGQQFTVDVEFDRTGFQRQGVDLTVELPDGVTLDRTGTANGDVTVEEVSGDVTARSSNGDVEVDDVDGYVRCETSNGDVQVRDTTGLRGAQSSNGEVDVDLLAMRDDVTCRSSNGSVTVRAGPEVAAGFRLVTNNGDVSVTDLPHTTTTAREKLIEGRLRGASDPTLTAETTNGDVTLRAAD